MLVFYCLARSYASDLPSCNAGKMAAQVSHAMSGVMSEWAMTESSHRSLVDEYVSGEKSAQGFSTSIILSANQEQIQDIYDILLAGRSKNVSSFLVIDPSYPFIASTEFKDIFDSDVTHIKEIGDNTSLYTRPETTCLGILIDTECETNAFIMEQIKSLPLHP